MAASSPADRPAADRARLRAQRAERLARLHPRPVPPAYSPLAAAGANDAALAEFLGALTKPAAPAGRATTCAAPAGRATTCAAPAGRATTCAAPAGWSLDQPPLAAVLHFHRPAAFVAEPQPPAAPVCDLDRLAGVGPDLVWALTRAGVTGRAGLARLEAADLAARLGPIGRLAPVAAWIAEARAATGA